MQINALILSDSDIGLSTHLGNLQFNFYIRTFILSFAYVILGLSSSQHQHNIRAITPLTTVIIIWHYNHHFQCASSSYSDALSSPSLSLEVIAAKILCCQPQVHRLSLHSVQRFTTCVVALRPLLHTKLCYAVFNTLCRLLLRSVSAPLHLLLHFFPSLCIICRFTSDSALGDAYICHPKILSSLHQQSMSSPMDSMFSLASSALSFDTSLSPIPAPQADTLVILPPIVLPTLLTSVPCLSII